MRTARPTAATILLILLAAHASAAGRHVQASLVSETESIQPGKPLQVAVRLQMDEGWHTYWKNPADSGLPTRMTWRLPEGLAAGPLQWPRPGRIAAGPLVSYGYEGEVFLPVEIAVAPSLAPGASVPLAGRVDWLECREACIPGKAELSLSLPVLAEAPRPSGFAGRFAETRVRLPVAAPEWKVAATTSARSLVLSFESAGARAKEAYFFPSEPQVLEYAAPQPLRRSGSANLLGLSRDPNGPKDLKRLKGVLVAEVADKTIALEVDAPVVAGAAATAPARGDGAPSGPGLPAALALAFLGGLVLNLMPCVLPVLSLKVLGFVRHAGEEGRAWRHGLAFTAGVLLSFWALAGLLLSLRAAGEQVGWGFQLQSPAFVVFLVALFFVLALNLFGVFEVGTSLIAAGNLGARSTGLGASFWSGALATIVATPCTAPFMGSALGFGLSQTAAVSLLVFTSLALGMAAPYLVLSLHPGWLRFMPRPGAWMEWFKQLMGFFLMATVAALAWLFGRQVGVDGMAALLAALVAIGLGAWIYGRASSSPSSRRRLLGSAAAGALVTVGLLAGLSRAGAAAPAEPGEWVAWSEEGVAAHRAAGRSVLVDFTADWCLTCQVNERVALRDPEVQARLREEGVVVMRADWTRHDPRITEALASHGRQGVPLYVLYGSGAGAPILLPEVITPGIVLDALSRARESGAGRASLVEEENR